MSKKKYMNRIPLSVSPVMGDGSGTISFEVPMRKKNKVFIRLWYFLEEADAKITGVGEPYVQGDGESYVLVSTTMPDSRWEEIH